MSTPRFVELPAGARALDLVTRRGTFAAHEIPAAGETRGSALLVPGFTGSKEDFIELLAPLSAAGFHVVAVDQRGQFETPGPAEESAYSHDELAADVLALTEAVAERSGGPAPHVLGHSFGGFTVRAAVLRAAREGAARGDAARHDAPDAGRALPWQSLTLMSTGPGTIADAEADRTRLLIDAITGGMDLESIWQVMRAMEEQARAADPGASDAVQPAAEDPVVADFLHRRWLGNTPAALVAMGRQLVDEPDRVEAVALAAVGAGLPVLVLSGETDDVWPVGVQEEMAARLGARYVRIAGAGHSPNTDRPVDTAQTLAEFWEKSRDSFH